MLSPQGTSNPHASTLRPWHYSTYQRLKFAEPSPWTSGMYSLCLVLQTWLTLTYLHLPINQSLFFDGLLPCDCPFRVPEANHPTRQVGNWQVHWQIDRSGCQVVWSRVKYNLMYVCSFYFPTWPSPWTNRWAPHHHLLNYYINWLPSMGPYSMSYMHLGSFSLTCLEQHFAQQTGICELDLFCAQDHLTCHAMGHPLHKGQCLLDQCIILCVSHLQQELSLASIFHTTCVIFVICVDRFIIH